MPTPFQKDVAMEDYQMRMDGYDPRYPDDPPDPWAYWAYEEPVLEAIREAQARAVQAQIDFDNAECYGNYGPWMRTDPVTELTYLNIYGRFYYNEARCHRDTFCRDWH